jgi:hypothetical protein
MIRRTSFIALPLFIALTACKNETSTPPEAVEGAAAEASAVFEATVAPEAATAAEGGAAPEAATVVEATQAAEASEAAEAVAAPRYRDLLEVLHGEGEVEAYVALRRRLAERFDEICGDTFCGGDYNDLASIRLTCSASAATSTVRECAWTFGGSYGAVDGPSGAVRTAVSAFACRFPVGANASSFVAKLAASDDPLYEPMPGRDEAIVDALYGCLQPPGPLPGGTAGRYVDAAEGLGGDDFLRFLDVRRALAERFEAVCGDSFCEGEYADVEPLALRCSVDPRTNEFGGCAWAFAGASAAIDPAGGRVLLDRATFACRLPIKGPVDAVLSALAGAEDPLDAPLPGAKVSINHALIDCLLAHPPARPAKAYGRPETAQRAPGRAEPGGLAGGA